MKFVHLLGAIALLLLSSACSTTRESSAIRETGFLKDYKRLSASEADGGEYWAHPDFDLDAYASLYVPQVEIWLSKENQATISIESASMLATLYHDQAVEKLRDRGWYVVDTPNMSSAVVRLALTEIESPNTAGSILTSIPIASTMVIKLTSIATDMHLFVGEASTEVQIVDARTGALLAEARDRRVGIHALLNMGSSWADVKDTIDVWT
ncbi:MAG: hypothetical protein ACI9C2_002415, partial [Gammaproteobacteria bacterium]